MTALARIYASAPASAFAIHTLELTNDAWSAPLRFVQAFEDVEAGIEGGELVTFLASGIALSLPQKGVQGREDLEFQLDNVSGEAVQAIRQALEAGTVTTVIYRPYASDDLSAPAQAKIEFVAVGARVNVRSVAVLATFRDFVNKGWPRKRYTLDITPGLKYVS